MSSSQPSRNSARSSAGGGGGPEETIIPILFGCVVVAVVGPAVLAAVGTWVMLRLERSSSAAVRSVAELWAEYWVLVVFWMVAAAALVLWRLVVRCQARRRQRQWKALAEGLARYMGKEWNPAKHLRVRRWRGLRPALVQVAITVTPQVMDREWRLSVTATARDMLGRIGPIGWPKQQQGMVAWRKPPWAEIRVLLPPRWWRRLLSNLWRRIRRHAPAADSSTVDDAAIAELEEKLITTLTGLVPSPRPTVTGDDLVVEYGETTRDQSPAWRARVVDQVSARLGTSFRALWDRQHRRFVLRPVPKLPHPIDWSEQNAKLQHLDLGPWVAAYGTDENGNVVAWQPGDREPHALMSGDPGTGKSESMKAIINSLLLQGALVAVIDPKQQDFAEYLGRPGVICVATAVEDQVGALVDLEAEMMRRTSAKALARLTKQYPELEAAALDAEDARYRSLRGVVPAQAAIDEVPLILVLDELTFHVAQVQEWWQRLTPPEKAEWGAEKSRQAPMLALPSRIVALARAIKIHVLLGMQRVDANNFGGSTAMRDNIRHMASMGRQSRIGSEMQWGDGRTGSEIEITNAGEGMSSGLRLDPRTGERLSRGTPGRFKAWYAANTAETPEFWQRVAAVAPDASLVRLPHVSAAARHPAAAAAALRAKAYEEYGDPSLTDLADVRGERPAQDEDDYVGLESQTDGELLGKRTALSVVTTPTPNEQDRSSSTEAWDPLLITAAEMVVDKSCGSAAMLQRDLRIGYERARQLMVDLESVAVVGPVQGRKARKVRVRSRSDLQTVLMEYGVIPPVSPDRPGLHLVNDVDLTTDVTQVETPLPDPPSGEVDENGTVWDMVSATAVEEGDMVRFGDITSALVMDAPGIRLDDLDQTEVVRLVLEVDGGEEVVDLSEDELIHRRLIH